MRNIALIAALLLGCCGSLRAGPIEDAQKLLQEKKYDEVDKALEKLLAQKDVPVEALRLSLEAAVARGRAITAQQRITALLKATQNQDLGLVYLGATIAEQAGDDRLALARYLAYAKAKNDKDEKLEQALRYVLSRGAYPEEYQKYAALFGKTAVSWNLGARLAAALFANEEATQAFALCESLLAEATHPAQVNHIHWLLWDASEKAQLGSDPEQRWVRPLNLITKYRPESIQHVENFIVSKLFTWDKCPQEVRADMLLKAQDMWKGRMPWNMLSRFGVLREIADEGRRLTFGKRYLTFEQVYKDNPDPNAYREYLHVMFESPQVFFVQGKELVSTGDMLSRFEQVAKNFGGDLNIMNHFVNHVTSSYMREDPPRVDFARKHLALLMPDRAAWLIGATKGENMDALIAELCKGRDGGWIMAFNGNLLPVLNQLGAVPEVGLLRAKPPMLAAARAWAGAHPGAFNWQHMQQHVMNSALLTVEDKLGVLRELLEKGGVSPPLKALIAELDKDKKNWGNQPSFQKLKQDLADSTKSGSDPLMRTHVAMYSLPWNQGSPHKGYYDAAKAFLDDFKDPLPTGDPLKDAIIGSICYRHFESGWNNRNAIDQAARLWAPRLKPSFCWSFLVQRVREHQSWDHLYRLAVMYLEQLKDGAGDPAVWSNIAQAVNPKNAKTSLFANHYDKMGPANAVMYLTRQQSLDTQPLLDDLAKIVSRPDFPFGNPGLVRELAQFVFQRCNKDIKPPVELTKALWKALSAQEDAAKSYDPGTEAWICGQFTRAERWPEALDHWNAFLAALAKRPLRDQVQAIACATGVMPRENPGELKPGARCNMLLKELKPRADKLHPGEWPSLVFYQDTVEDMVEMLTKWPDGDAKKDARALSRTLALMFASGARYEGRPLPLMQLLSLAAQDTLAEQNWPALSRITQSLAANLRPDERDNWEATLKDIIQPTVLALKKNEAFEPAFVFLDQAAKRGRLDDNTAKQVAVLKAEMGRAIPEVTVQKTDPAFDLHSAARALGLGGEARAWELTQPRLPLLKKLWTELDPAFVAWAVEQMRKQKMSKEAMDMCFTILLRELDLDAEIAATVILTKGDCYCDMQNFQAARIEYEGLKNNKRYAKTDAGARAKYRLIALMIATKDYTRAEELLQLLVDSDNVDIQAEAYFLYAKMAFDQQQYEEARKHLAEVFKRKLDHVEGKLLEGELRLLVRGGLASTEVEAGTPELGKVAIPGLPLTLKLQDQNLAISQGGQAVKVLVTTSKGGDEERINLHAAPGTRDVFSATIQTSLGKVQKGDVTLQLRGDDVVSYVIDPEYQKAHNINYPPKTLAVKYDPRLMVSSGEILSEEEQEKRDFERRQRLAQGLESARFTGRDERTVRPGSPIYVQVTDLAQDLSDEPDIVRVTAQTASGDTLENVEVKETGPHTGVFRGQIPTGIPQPRVNVSDSEEGKNPGVVIRPGNKENWNSLADGLKPKWLEVDTMSSHLVKSAAITLPDPKAIKQISLFCMLADEYAEIAAYPQRAAMGGLGLKGDYRNERGFNSRVVLSRIDAVVNYTSGSPGAKVNAQNFSCRWTGRIVPKFSEAYTFHTVSDDGVRLWVNNKLLVDNWTSHGTTENTGAIPLQANMPVDIKIEYFQGDGEGTMQLCWSSKTQKRELVPQSCLLPPSTSMVFTGGAVVRMTMCSGVAGGSPDPEAIRGYLKTQPTTHVPLEQFVFDRAATPYRGRQGWMTNRLSGVFFLRESMDVELKFLQKPSPSAWQTAYLLIDDRLILGGSITAKTLEKTRKETLARGPHRIEVLLQDHWENSQVTVGYRKAAGAAGAPAADFAALPDNWFSVKENPEIEPFLRRGRVEPTPTGFLATLTEPERLRKVKWIFEDFAGNAVSVQNAAITDSKDAVVIPVAGMEKTAEGARKNLLEVAPGDQIEISYASERRIREDTPLLTSMLNSSFFNGTVLFANEVIKDDPDNNRRDIFYQPAKRCRVGDTLAVIVHDNDCDLTDERDTVSVTVRTTSGAQLELKALETSPDNPADELRCKHSGFFLAMLKIGATTEKDTIAVKPGDMLTVSHLDKENTNPGIPFERTYSVEETGKSQPEIIVYRTRTEIVEDTSPEALAKIERLKMRGAPTQGLQVFKTRIVAQHPDFVPDAGKPETKNLKPETPAPAADAGKPETKNLKPETSVAVDVGAPILLEAVYPRQALNSGSVLKAEAVPETEVQAAAKENRQPKPVEVPMTILPVEQLAASKGYPVQIQRPFPRSAKDMLQEGCFAGVVRLQIGSPGDPIDDLVVVGLGEFGNKEELKTDTRFRIPTLLVSGSDTVHLKVKDEDTGQFVTQDIKLLSDARLEILDSTYTVMRDAIHLGETFYLRLTDPDQDVSNARDKVPLDVKSSSGGSVKLELTETLPHSGIFTGSLKPEFGGAGQAGGAAGVLRVNFGDEVTFAFHDPDTLKGPGTLDVVKKAKIHYGANGEIAAFTKVFSDPEMAVKTRFLMAEALFEMAKEHRKLKQEEKATEEVAQGKRILEEAMRDYPHTSLVAQGEFLLANLAQELGSPNEAISRYASVISQWPESEYAVRSLFKMAICQEKAGSFDQACENYVRVIYLYPDSDLVADAKIRLGNYYYKEKQYKVAAKIFAQFQKQTPTHPLAAKTLFLAGQCHIKVEDWKSAIEALDLLVTTYADQKEVRSEAMYWLGESYSKANDFRQAYRTFKKITWDYPESKWAKIARGRLTEEVFAQIETEDSASKQEQ